MFDLEKAIATWRHNLNLRRTFQSRDLDELEVHIRDHVTARRRNGKSEETAFWEAVRDVGGYDEAEGEYRKIFWEKLRHNRTVMQELRWRGSLFISNLQTARRNLARKPGYTLLNGISLALGISVCLLVFLYVRNEYSYDRFHPNVDRIYRVDTEGRLADRPLDLASIAGAVGPLLKKEFPEVQETVRLFPLDLLVQSTPVPDPDHVYQENEVYAVDSTFFTVFGYSLKRGDVRTCLAAPFSVVLTENTAQKFFGDSDPVGRRLWVNGGRTFTVTGVVADPPRNSHLAFELLVSMTSLSILVPNEVADGWSSLGFYTYALLVPGVSSAGLQARLPAFMDTHLIEDLRARETKIRPVLAPLSGLHLHSHRENEPGTTGNPLHLYLYAVIGLFILVISCANFVNLATARATERVREVGIRKALGAVRGQLVVQLLVETLCITSLSACLAFVLAWLVLPVFNQIIEGDFTPRDLLQCWFVLPVLILGVVLAAGIYPALMLARSRPAVLFLPGISGHKPVQWFRQSLVVFQFFLSITLMIITGVVFSQVHFLRSQDPGFQKEQVLILEFDGDERTRADREALKKEMLSVPGVIKAAYSSHTPGNGSFDPVLDVEDVAGQLRTVAFPTWSVDYDFVDLYDLKMLAGRAFSTQFTSDSLAALIVNEAAARSLGYTSVGRIVGQRFHRPDGLTGSIVGVVKDFNHRSLHQKVGPLVLTVRPERYRELTLRIHAGDIHQTVQQIRTIWKQRVPYRPLKYRFLADSFDRQYRGEERFEQVMGYCAVLAVVIACLGLFGLASFTTTRRTKEIGIRKALGASEFRIVALLSQDFLKPVIVAFVLAAPAALFLMLFWLDRFAYRITPGPGWFVIGGLLAFAIAFVTVGSLSVRAARANPVQSLRYE